MQLLCFYILFEPISNILLLFSHLADAFIQSDLQKQSIVALKQLKQIQN